MTYNRNGNGHGHPNAGPTGATSTPYANGFAVLHGLGAGDLVDTYLLDLAAGLAAVSRADIWAAVEMVVETGRAGRRIYLIGNGGSAATASHMANDLGKAATAPGRPALRAIALTDNVPLVTAWANDAEYAECFARQLACHVEPGDLVVAISTSGDSENILRALDLARAAGARSIGLTGRDGGAMRARVDCCIRAPCDHIGQQEDVHLALNHAITIAVRARLAAGG